MESIELLVDGEGFLDVETVSVPKGCAVRDVIAVLAPKRGLSTTDVLIFLEDSEEPLDLNVVVTEEARRRVHHLHRARKIDVVVSYQSGTKEKRFSPSARVQRVLDWSVGPDGFKIDPAIAPEMELALSGETKPLPKNAHIGRFARHDTHRLELDLIRGVIPNGDR